MDMEEEKKVEKEAKEVKEDYLETEPIEESGQKYYFPWRGFIIVFGVLITLIIVCVVVILCNGGFDQWSK